MSDKYESVTHVVQVTVVVEMSRNHCDIRGADVRVCSSIQELTTSVMRDGASSTTSRLTLDGGDAGTQGASRGDARRRAARGG